MGRSIVLLIAHIVLFSLTLSGQCPDRDSLWKRLIYLKNSANAVPWTEQLKELKNYEAGMKSCPYRNDSTHAFLLQRMGAIYFILDDYSQAVQYTLQSISMIESHAKPLAHQDRLTYCYDYYNLRSYYETLHRIKEQNAAIDSCVSIAMRFNLIDDDILHFFQDRIKFLFYIGDYQRCIRYTRLGEILIGQYLHGSDSLIYAMFLLTWEANVLILYKQYDVAANLLFSKAGVCEKAGAKKDEGNIYSQIADTYLGKGDYQKSVFYYQKALSYHKGAGDFLNCKITLNNLGEVYSRYLHDDALALRYYKKAIGYVSQKPKEKIIDALQTLDAFNKIAMVYLQKRDYDSCFANFQIAFDQIRPGIRDSDLVHLPISEFTENRNIDLVINLLINKADAYQQKFLAGKDKDALTQALRIYKLTDVFLDKLRAEHSETESMLFWRKESRRLYEHAIEACWFARKTQEAFYFFEKSRSVLLNDQLNELSSMDNEKIEQLSQVRRKILQLQREKNQEDLVNELFNSKQELDRLEELVKKADHLPYQNFPDSGLSYVRKDLLQDHQGLLELFNGDSAVYSLLVSAEYASLDRIDKSDLDSTTGLYLSYISNPDRLNGNFAGYAGVAHHLYQLIFREAPPPKGRIIISQDGRYFPFEALLVNDNPAAPLYFVEEHATSYTYSAYYLMNHYSTRLTAPAGNFMGVAPVQYRSSFKLATLNGSDESLDRIGSYFSGVHNLVANEASKDHFFRQFSGYKIIQLYTHASDSGSNGEPVIYFSDSVLYLSDLIPKDRPATQLIVLSACETGNGTLHQGEGVFNFNRGFAALGIPSSITNLWMVEDKATYRLTELFYKQLAEGVPPDIALQRAKIAFIRTATKEKRLPFYWAATILAGKTNPIDYTRTAPWKWIGLFVGIILVFLWIFSFVASRRNSEKL
ncbi:MAG TPA: CHAT domain-containing tetratricopeptide repeat protein [Puia sp.]|nr:CHAT domain-containing tetratricopeptide repeat protein [Puia sp.]